MKCPPTPKPAVWALDKAVALAGSETRLSRATGWSQPAINKARRRGRVSAELAIAIERALAGAVTRAELRPDLFVPNAKK